MRQTRALCKWVRKKFRLIKGKCVLLQRLRLFLRHKLWFRPALASLFSVAIAAAALSAAALAMPAGAQSADRIEGLTLPHRMLLIRLFKSPRLTQHRQHGSHGCFGP